MKISIVTTLYKSEGYIKEFYSRMSAEVQKITNDYEIIFVNDGSPDNSFEVVNRFIENDHKVKLIDLSRNFGHHQAVMAGLEYSCGQHVFLIDSDLEEPPEDLGLFWDKIKSDSSIDVVYGVQEKRRGGWFERLSGHMFYVLFNYLSGLRVSRSQITSRLMSRRYVMSLQLFPEREFIAVGVWSLAGFKQVPLFVKKGSKGGTSYSLFKKIEMMSNAIISFSDYPLLLIFRLGLMITLLAVFALVYIIMGYMLSGESIAGWRSLIVSIWFFGGVTLMCLGVIGRYLGKVFIEVKQRPRVVIRQIISKE